MANIYDPILVNTCGSYIHHSQSFLFESFKIRDDSNYAVIVEAWDSTVFGSATISLKENLKLTKSDLKDWNFNHFDNIHVKLKAFLAALDSVQKYLPSPKYNAKEESIQVVLQEELLWKLKSRELWLTCRDLNTKFFHNSMMVKRKYNSITCIKLDNGSFLYNRNDIGSHLVS